MKIAGIDPGMSGAIAIITNGVLKVYDMPSVNVASGKKQRRKIAGDVLAVVITDFDHVFIEKAQSMPGQGVASTFNYGESYGTIKGICYAKSIPFTEVHPRTWKKAMLTDQNKSSKDISRYRAMQLWPGTGYFDRKKDEHRAEAALIAEYGRRKTATASQEGELSETR